MAIPGLEVTERPWAGSADARTFAQSPGPGNPNVPPGGSAEARTLRASVAAPTQPVAAPPSVLGRVRSTYDGLTGRNFVGPQRPAGALSRLGAVAGAASEAPNVLAVATDPNATKTDVATQVAGATGKLAAAGLGAKAGAAIGALGGPVGGVAGGLVGGVAGYFGADSAIKAGRSMLGTEVDDPADREVVTSVPLTKPGATPGQPPAAQAPSSDAFAGPPASAASGTTVSLRGNVLRNGNEYSGTNVSGAIGVNGQPPGGGIVSPQNMAAADNLMRSETLRGLAGAPAAQVPMAVSPTVRHSGNDWQSRNDLRNLEVSASSIKNRPEWQSGSSTQAWSTRSNGVADPDGKIAAYQAALKQDIAMRGAQPGVDVEVAKSNNALRGQQLGADAARESSRNSLRGTMYSADAQLGGKQLEIQQKLRQQQLMGSIYQAAGGDPVKASRLAASAGLDGKQFAEMASADQARTQGNVKDARGTFENMFTRDGKDGPERDENAEALAHNLASQIVPGWENMNAEQRAANRTKVVDATRMVQGMNSLRNTDWLQKAGIDAPTPAYSQLPDMGGATVSDVGMWEGLTTPNVRSGDKKILLRDSGVRYLPQGQLSESQLRLLQDNGAKRQ